MHTELSAPRRGREVSNEMVSKSLWASRLRVQVPGDPIFGSRVPDARRALFLGC